MEHVSFEMPINRDECPYTVYMGKALMKDVISLYSNPNLKMSEDISFSVGQFHSHLVCALHDYRTNNRDLNSAQLNYVLYKFCRDLLSQAEEPVISYLN